MHLAEAVLSRYAIALPLLVASFYAVAFARHFQVMVDPLSYAAFCGYYIPGQIEQIKREGWNYRGVDVRTMMRNGPTGAWQVATALTLPGSLVAEDYLANPGPIWFKYAELVAPIVVGLPCWILLGFWFDRVGLKSILALYRTSRTGRLCLLLLFILAAVLILATPRPLPEDVVNALLLGVLLFWTLATLGICAERLYRISVFVHRSLANPLR